MTDLFAFALLTGICISVVKLHSYLINEATDRMKNLREKIKDNNYLQEIIKIKKKRKNSLVRKKRKTSLLKKNAFNFR